MQRRVKLLLEWPLALLLLLLSLPVLLLLVCLILATAGRPALYREQRLGRGGQPFTLLKLRTLRESAGASIAPEDDARILPLGRPLRRWRLDELPQLLNVVKGDMSLVGPRPLSRKHADTVGEEALRRLHAVRPGITGAAALAFLADDVALSGREDAEAAYLSTLLPAKVAVELDYLDRWSLALDARLLVLTLLQLWSPAARRRSRDRVRHVLPAARSGSRPTGTPPGNAGTPG